MEPPQGCPRGLGGRKGQATYFAVCPSTSRAISSILGPWLDQYSEHLSAPDFPCLKQLVAYMQLNMPGSNLEHHVHFPGLCWRTWAHGGHAQG